MEPVTVIRIEYPESGLGLFRSTKTDEAFDESGELDALRQRHYNFPMPHRDGISMSLCGAEWFCAFKSVDQVKQWVTTEEITFLKSLGFVVYMLDVTEYQLGGSQVAFTKESIVSKKDVSSLF